MRKNVGTRTEDLSGSWVIREKTTGKVLFETFDIRKVRALNTGKYEAVPILRYLYELNDKIKANGGRDA